MSGPDAASGVSSTGPSTAQNASQGFNQSLSEAKLGNAVFEAFAHPLKSADPAGPKDYSFDITIVGKNGSLTLGGDQPKIVSKEDFAKIAAQLTQSGQTIRNIIGDEMPAKIISLAGV